MPWVEDVYYYTAGILRAIVECYDTLHEVLTIGDYKIVNRYSLAEFKADFDISLSSIGRGKWEGVTGEKFTGYKRYGRMQRIIIAQILGINDYELEGLGFYDIPKLRGLAYFRMLENLNDRKETQS